MKTKKCLTVLLALVMLLSILPMAAFAASCAHGNVNREWTKFADVKASSHSRYKTYHDYYHAYLLTCTSCGYAWEEGNTATPVYEEEHVFTIIKYLGEETESGDTWYRYSVVCYTCGFAGEVYFSERRD